MLLSKIRGLRLSRKLVWIWRRCIPRGHTRRFYRRLEVLQPKQSPPKGHVAVYAAGGDDEKEAQRYVVPIFYLNHPLFGDLLREAEEKSGFYHPAGGITIPCLPSRFDWVQTRIAACYVAPRRSGGDRKSL